MSAAAGAANPESPTLRVDKWLWFARFFKSRAQASRLCASGRLRVSGTVVVKAHHPVRPGDVLTFPQGRHIRVVRVKALAARRGPAVEACALYEDVVPPARARPLSEEATARRPRGAGRPTKADRRAIMRLKHGPW